MVNGNCNFEEMDVKLISSGRSDILVYESDGVIYLNTDFSPPRDE